MRNLFLTLIAAAMALPSLAQTTTDSRYKRIELSFVSRHDNWELQNPDMSSKGIAAAFIMGRPITAKPQIAIEIWWRTVMDALFQARKRATGVPTGLHVALTARRCSLPIPHYRQTDHLPTSRPEL